MKLVPVEPAFSSEEARRETYRGWPVIQISPERMAKAGLYYFHSERGSDSVRCYFCGGCLHNWEAGDDPDIEHARFFPGCPARYEHLLAQYPTDLRHWLYCELVQHIHSQLPTRLVSVDEIRTYLIPEFLVKFHGVVARQIQERKAEESQQCRWMYRQTRRPQQQQQS